MNLLPFLVFSFEFGFVQFRVSGFEDNQNPAKLETKHHTRK
jgi:hypothetical protein